MQIRCWSQDYGQFCLLTCEKTYSPSPPERLGTWMICRDDGRWSPQPNDCDCRSCYEVRVYLTFS
ncbi:hypothetical protein DPMN_095238 [Dreissena polymorpha]|uniref:Sushi domain-containing protein n=1 Tax=Dreissena polymorpha TaxID=45954 RepID=A0A9D4L7I9_DREPO|nr:hypothetical protein DPMN_095238 [Dreissena polymorpha]